MTIGNISEANKSDKECIQVGSWASGFGTITSEANTKNVGAMVKHKVWEIVETVHRIPMFGTGTVTFAHGKLRLLSLSHPKTMKETDCEEDRR